MQEYDEDGNEVIDFLEFYRVRNCQRGLTKEQPVQRYIQMYQTFQDEAIQFPELELRHTLNILETNDKKLTKGQGSPDETVERQSQIVGDPF